MSSDQWNQWFPSSGGPSGGDPDPVFWYCKRLVLVHKFCLFLVLHLIRLLFFIWVCWAGIWPLDLQQPKQSISFFLKVKPFVKLSKISCFFCSFVCISFIVKFFLLQESGYLLWIFFSNFDKINILILWGVSPLLILFFRKQPAELEDTCMYLYIHVYAAVWTRTMGVQKHFLHCPRLSLETETLLNHS